MRDNVVLADIIKIVGELRNDLYTNSYVNDMRDGVVFGDIIDCGWVHLLTLKIVM